MDYFFGSFRSYFIAVLLLLIGVGGFLFLKFKPVDQESAAIDISTETGYDWNNLTEGMHVVLNANNCAGYTTHSAKGGQETSRLYYVFNYSQKTNDYSKIIMIYTEPKDYASWDTLEKQKLSPKETLKTITVDAYTKKMTPAEFKDARNVMLTSGSFDMDELEDMIVPYMLAPKEAKKELSPILNIATYVLMGLGGLFLIGSIIGSVKHRYL